MITRALTGFLFGALVSAAPAQVIQEAFLPANAPIQSDILGYDVAMDGAIIVGGAPFGTLNGLQQAGRAFVFELQEGVWQQTRVLRPAITQGFAFFGIDVDVHENIIAVSALGEQDRTGAVYMFEKTDRWRRVQKVVASNRNSIDLFGGGISISDDFLVIGSVGHATPSGSETGGSFIFEHDGTEWVESAMLYPAQGTAFGNFGFDSAVAGSTVAIAALADDNQGVNRAGAIHVFDVAVGGAWSETAKLVPSDPVERGELGIAVAMNHTGTMIVGGAPGAFVDGIGTGAVYIYELNNGVWEQSLKLVAHDGQGGDAYGQAVAIDGDTLLVGAFLEDQNGNGAGATYVYRRNAGKWVFDTKLVAHVPGNLTYGWALTVQDDRAVVAAPFYQLNQGALYVYTGLSGCEEACDMNCDGTIDSLDIEPFLGLLFGGSQPCNTCTGDVNGDGTIDALDIEPFLECLFQ